MAVFTVAFNMTERLITVLNQGINSPEGYTQVGTFEHDADDSLGSLHSHVLWHHVRDILYPLGVWDMHRINITVDGQVPGIPPIINTNPVITGESVEGQILSVTPGTWFNNPTGFTYQWKRDGVAIADSINTTRTLTTADVGKVISCSVTATNIFGSATAQSNETETIEGAPTPIPVNTVAPAITGITEVGETLSVSNGTWSNGPDSYTYQWRRAGVNISGATANTYELTMDDSGANITCRVIATNEGGSGVAISNQVTVTVYVFSPGELSQLTAAFTGYTGVTSAGANVAGAYGTSRSLAVPSGGTAPTVEANAYNGDNALRYPGGAVKTHKFNTDVVFTGACRGFAGFLAEHTSSSKTVVGRDTNNQESIRISVCDGVTNASITVRVCSTAAYVISLGRPITKGAHFIEWYRDAAGVLTVWLDNEQIGQQSGHTGASTWNAIGYNAAGVNTWQGLIKEVLLFDESTVPLTSDERNKIVGHMKLHCRSKVHIDFENGNDSNDGSNWTKARKTFRGTLNIHPHRPGQQFVVKNGVIHEGDGIYIDTNLATALSTFDDPWVIEVEDIEDDWFMIRNRVLPTGWTQVGATNVWKTTIALTIDSTDGEIVIAGRYTDGATKTRLYTSPDNTPDLNQIFYDGTDLFINIGTNPTGKTIEVTHKGTLTDNEAQAAVRVARPYVQVRGFKTDLWPGNSIRIGHANNGILIEQFEAVFGALDSINISAGYQTIRYGTVRYPGRRKDGQGSGGDTLTAHGTSGALVQFVVCYGAGKGGVANEKGATMNLESCEFYDCYKPIWIINQGTGSPGTLTMRDCIIERPADAGFDDAILLDEGLTSAYTAIIEDCTMTGDGTVRGKAINNIGGVTLTQARNEQTGFSSLT